MASVEDEERAEELKRELIEEDDPERRQEIGERISELLSRR